MNPSDRLSNPFVMAVASAVAVAGKEVAERIVASVVTESPAPVQPALRPTYHPVQPEPRTGGGAFTAISAASAGVEPSAAITRAIELLLRMKISRAASAAIAAMRKG